MGRNKNKIVILLLLLLALIVNFDLHAAIINVGKTHGITSIQTALNNSKSYDTVIVHSGIYKEKISIEKPVFLSGEGRPVIDGLKKYELISVFSSNVTIQGFELRNGGISSMDDLAGIKIYRAKNVVIRNNFLYEMFFAIYFQECVSCYAINNSIHSTGTMEVQSGNGIHCWKSDSMRIFQNNISGQRDGIYFEFVTNSLIESNLSEKNIRYGLHFMFSHDNKYMNNIIQNNGAGVAVMYTHHVSMINNIFNDNWGASSYGLLMKEISDSEIRNNKFIGNTNAIYLDGSNRNKITDNIFSGNGCALKIQASCENNIIEKNNFRSNTFDVTTNGSLVMNTFRANYWDKYEGYDLNHDKTGDIPYHPISLYSMIIEQMPVATIFLRSFMVSMLDKTEKAIPSLTPDNFKDDEPKMSPYKL